MPLNPQKRKNTFFETLSQKALVLFAHRLRQQHDTVGFLRHAVDKRIDGLHIHGCRKALNGGEHVAEQNDLPVRRHRTEAGIVVGKGVLDLLELEEPRVREGEVAAGTDDLPGTVSQHRLVNGNAQKLVDMRTQIFGNRA